MSPAHLLPKGLKGRPSPNVLFFKWTILALHRVCKWQAGIQLVPEGRRPFWKEALEIKFHFLPRRSQEKLTIDTLHNYCYPAINSDTGQPSEFCDFLSLVVWFFYLKKVATIFLPCTTFFISRWAAVLPEISFKKFI